VRNIHFEQLFQPTERSFSTHSAFEAPFEYLISYYAIAQSLQSMPTTYLLQMPCSIDPPALVI